MIRVQLADADRVVIGSLDLGTLPEGVRAAVQRLKAAEGARYVRVLDIRPDYTSQAAGWELHGGRLYPRNNLTFREEI